MELAIIFILSGSIIVLLIRLFSTDNEFETIVNESFFIYHDHKTDQKNNQKYLNEPLKLELLRSVQILRDSLIISATTKNTDTSIQRKVLAEQSFNNVIMIKDKNKKIISDTLFDAISKKYYEKIGVCASRRYTIEIEELLEQMSGNITASKRAECFEKACRVLADAHADRSTDKNILSEYDTIINSVRKQYGM
jgi:hypothetical protein